MLRPVLLRPSLISDSLHTALWALAASRAIFGLVTGCPSTTSDVMPIAHRTQTQLLQDDFDEEQCPEGFTLQGAVPEATQAAAEDPSKPGPSAGELL